MKCWKFFLVFAIACSQIVRATQTASPYSAIVSHNSFGLVTPPSPTVQDAKTPPPEITLNGLMTIFGDKRALFKVRNQSSGKEDSYILSEGQRDGDIQLLSVDVKGSSITVNNHGFIQTIGICKTAILQMIENKAAANGGINPAANDHSKFSSNPSQTPAPEFQDANGQPAAFQSGYQVGLANSKNPSSADKNANANSNNSQNSSGANPGASKSVAPKFDPWWVRGSKMVEQARVDSANAVLNGTADPQPLTPLTPPGTPANLIGSDLLFFDHM